MPRPGRPRGNPLQKSLKSEAEAKKRLEAIVDEKLGSPTSYGYRMALETACLLSTLEKGSRFAKARCEPLIRRLRRSKWGSAVNVPATLPDTEFLERFIEVLAPGWNWRKSVREGEIEDDIDNQRNERFDKERADDARWGLSCTSKFFTPDVPDAVQICHLAWEWRRPQQNRRRVTRREWPTLRELKLATAIPERTIKKIIKRLRPKEGEIIKTVRNKFSRRGAVPLRYGLRLVIGVLNEFVNRLPEFPLDDEERKKLRKVAINVKRAFVARLSSSRSST